MRLLCGIGIHSWKNGVVAEYKMGYCSAVIDGQKCQHCGKTKQSWSEIVTGLPDPFGWGPPASTEEVLTTTPRLLKLTDS